MPLASRWWLAALVLAWSLPSWAETLTGRVVGVHDGDTLTLLTADKTSVKVRLAQVDAPELGQPYGKDSKKVLSDLVFDREVRVEVLKLDRYGRTVGEVFVGTVDVDRRMVHDGAAWAFRQYLTDSSLLDVEADAGRHQRGLWALQADQRIPPWEWRKAKREKRSGE